MLNLVNCVFVTVQLLKSVQTEKETDAPDNTVMVQTLYYTLEEHHGILLSAQHATLHNLQLHKLKKERSPHCLLNKKKRCAHIYTTGFSTVPAINTVFSYCLAQETFKRNRYRQRVDRHCVYKDTDWHLHKDVRQISIKLDPSQRPCR